MKLVIVVAMARNRTIGRDNGLPWHLPEDLQHFKAVTMGKPMIMGRKTWESIGRPLPGRTSIVVSRQQNLKCPDGMVAVTSLDAAVEVASRLVGDEGSCCVIGGAEIYRQMLPLTDVIELTLIDRDVDGDTCFPELDPEVWHQERYFDGVSEQGNGVSFAFLRLRRA